MTTIVRCARAVAGGEERRDFSFAIVRDQIAATGSFDDLALRFPKAEHRVHGDGVAVLPGLVNAHSHAYQVLLRGWADDLPFERWRSEALYRIVPRLTPDQVYWTFLLAFDEMLAAGITTVAEFFYLNGAGNAHAREVFRAAADSGIRLVFARTWMDAPYAPAAFRESIEQARARTAALMDEFAHLPICVAPHSLHAASHEMIRAAAGFARERDCMLHVHAAERADAGQIELLAQLGALGERTVAVHAIHVSDEEKRLIARSGARVVHNPTTNQYLGDGICDLTGLDDLGVAMGLGTDANVNPSILDEMRAASFLQKLRSLDGEAFGAKKAFALGTMKGALTLGIDAGDLREGAYADYAVLDLTHRDPWAPLLNHVVYRSQNADVRETYVAGQRVGTRAGQPRSDALHALRDLFPDLRR